LDQYSAVFKSCLQRDGLVKSLKITNIQFSHPVISMGYEIDF
jgi:hypothetical protein